MFARNRAARFANRTPLITVDGCGSAPATLYGDPSMPRYRDRIFSDAVSGASSLVAVRKRSGSASLWMVRSVEGTGAQANRWCRASRTSRTAPAPARRSRRAVARQVGEQMVLDLVAQVAARERQQRTGFEVRGAQHLPQIPLGPGLVLEHVRGELLRAVGKVPAEDHHVRPEVAQQVGRPRSPPGFGASATGSAPGTIT